LKLVDANKHKKYTGIDNTLILENFQALCNLKQPMHVRIPLIPGITDTNENMDGLVHLLKGQEAVKRVDLLPYHAISLSKYQRFGMPFRMDEALRSDQEKARTIYTQFQQAGLPAVYEG
jgi:pyruvate formate lyase activating enzyme